MRPIELSLEGFTSFRTKQTLDFSNLDLFAITGATGSGKSSLLDAIAFALYGKVARNTKINELVSQGATTLKVEFRFAARQSLYRVTRSWRYRPSSPEIKFLLDEFKEGEWKRCDRTQKIEDILGMDFDTFTRVIVLPQGQFDKFLQGEAPKRREILRQLANFEIFEKMRETAQQRYDALNAECKAIERQLEDLNVPTEEAIAQKQHHLTTLEEELPALNQSVFQAQKALDEEEKLFENLTRLNSLEKDLATLKANSAEIETWQRRLILAKAADRLKPNYALVLDARKRDKDAQAALKLAVDGLTEAQQKLAKEQENLQEARDRDRQMAPQIEAMENALTAAKVYEEQSKNYQIEVSRAENNNAQKAARLAEATEELAHAEANLKTKQLQQQKAEAAKGQYAPGGTRLEQLNQVMPLLNTWKVLQEQTHASSSRLEKTARDKQAAEKTLAATVLELERSQIALQQAETALETAEATNAKSVQQNHAAALRLTLHDGDTCPVCSGVYSSATHIALPTLSLIDTTTLRAQKDAALKSHAAAQNAKTKAELATESLAQKELEHRQDWQAVVAKFNEMQQQITAILKSDNWEADALAREQRQLQESDAKYRQALTEQKEAAALLQSAERDLQMAQDARERALLESQSASEEYQRWIRQLEAVKSKLHEITGGQSYDTLRQTLEREKQALERLLQQATQSHQAAHSRAIQAQAEEKQARETAGSHSIQKENLEFSWLEALQGEDFTEGIFLKSIVSVQEQAQWQSAIASWSERKIQLETRIEEVSREIGARETNAEKIREMRAAKQKSEEKFRGANDERAKLIAWIQNSSDKQQQSDRLRDNLEALQEQAQIYYTLARNLRGNEFQAYILEHLETELVDRATILLQELSDSRYSLKIHEGEYWVEDNWNGGELRRARTLSGGETFAASLSMALALSEKLSMGVELGSLFLDEGFGTLDIETLESVTQILESLRQQDRLIGVITHVRSLAERLPTQVRVQKSPEGSHLKVESPV